jgi:hypothetical protein
MDVNGCDIPGRRSGGGAAAAQHLWQQTGPFRMCEVCQAYQVKRSGAYRPPVSTPFALTTMRTAPQGATAQRATTAAQPKLEELTA